MAQQPRSAARSVLCQSCGGAIPLSAITPAVTCPYCQHVQALDADVLRELTDYQAQTEAHFQNARHELEQAQAWQSMTGRPGTSAAKNTIVGIALMMGVPIIVSMGGAFLFSAGLLPQAYMPFLSLAAIGAFMVSFIAYMIWYYGGKRSQASISVDAPSNVTCPNCGAMSTFQVGQVVETCTHCGGALLASATVVGAGVAAAHQVARAAQMQRFRTERSGMATYSGYSMSSSVPYFILGSFGLVIVVPTIMFSVGMLRGSEPYDPAIFLMWGLSCCLVGTLVGIVLYRRRQRRRFETALRNLAHQLSGQVGWGVNPVVEWLNAFWAGPYVSHQLMVGRLACAVAASPSQYPLLIFIDPIGMSEHYPPKIELLLAAWIPGLSDGTGRPLAHTAETRRLRQWLGESGFSVEYNQAGLYLRGDEMVAKAIRKMPAENAAKLPEIASRLVRLAVGLGASPVERIP